MAEQKTQAEFLRQALLALGDGYDFSSVNYINSHKKVTITCLKHGEFSILPGDVVNKKRGCPLCTKERIRLGSYREFCRKLYDLFGDSITISEDDYSNSNTKSRLFCKRHGYFETTPHSIVNKKSAGACSGCELDRRKAEYLSKVSQKYGDRYKCDLSTYEYQNSRISVFCRNCSETFVFNASSLLRGSECPVCKKLASNRKIEESFLEKAPLVHDNFYDYSMVSYTGCMDKVSIICPAHGVFHQTVSNHLEGKGCKECSNYRRGRWHSLIHGDDTSGSFKDKPCTLYLIRMTFGKDNVFTKIGITTNVTARFQKLSNESGAEIVVLSKQILKTPICVAKEKQLHRALGIFRRRPPVKFGGMYELYRIDQTTINRVVEYMSSDEMVFHYEPD